MKRLIHCLFAVAAISAAIVPQAHAEKVKKWVMIALLFEGNEVADTNLVGFNSADACKKAQEQLADGAKKAKVEIWSACVLMEREKVVVGGDPKTKQSS